MHQPQISSRVREFETLLGAGVVDSRGQHANTVGRMVEALALSSGYVASGRGGGVDPATAPFTSTVYVLPRQPKSTPCPHSDMGLLYFVGKGGQTRPVW